MCMYVDNLQLNNIFSSEAHLNYGGFAGQWVGKQTFFNFKKHHDLAS